MKEDIRYSSIDNVFEVIHRDEVAAYAPIPHIHNGIEIYFNLSDLKSVLIGSNLLEVEKDTIIVIPAHCVHNIIPNESCAYNRYVLSIKSAWFDQLLDIIRTDKYSYLTESEIPMILPVNKEEKELFIQSLEKLIACENSEIFSRMSCFFDFLGLLHLAVEQYNINGGYSFKEEISGTKKTVQDIIAYINEHINENIKVKDIADNFFLSSDYIARIFKKYTQTQISNYITIQKISKAKQLLAQGRTVTQTQIEMGYSSYSLFFHTFKKVVGRTPTQFRNRRLKK